MKKYYLALSLMMSISLLHTQSDPIGLIFKITAAEAAYLYIEGQDTIPPHFFHTVVDTFALPTAPLLRKNGHYLEVSPDEENVSTTLHSIHSHSLFTINNGRDLALRLIDEKGQEKTDALVRLNQKKIRFNAKTQSYSIKRTSKGGMLWVEVPGDTLFYQLSPQNKKPLLARRYRYFTSSGVGYAINGPIRWSKRLYYFFRNGFKYGEWHRRFRSRQKERNLNGYLATNKPKYLPGDTLLAKAYVTYPNGRPVRKPISLIVRQYGKNRSFLDTLLQPASPGAFLLNWPINDTMILNRAGQLTLSIPRRTKLNALYGAFLYEDYQLDEVIYGFKTATDTFRQGQAFHLLVSAKDQNELPIYDAQVKLSLHPEKFLSFHDDEMLIPDTIWNYETAIDQKGELKLLVPDSLFPPVKMRIEAIAHFSNSNGEIQQKNLQFTYTPLADFLNIKLQRGQFQAQYMEGAVPIAASGLLLSQQAQHHKIDTQTIKLPLSIAIHPTVQQYTLLLGKVKKTIDMASMNAGVSFETVRQEGQVKLLLQNPHKLAVNWIIRHSGGTLAEGFTQDSIFYTQIPDGGARLYQLHYQYLWAGREQTGTEEIYRYKKMLQVKIEQAKQVMPGQEVQVKVSVKDYKSRPVKNVNLTAGAINSKFNSSNNFQSPNVTYKKGKAPFFYNEFDLTPFRTKQPFTPIDRSWYERLNMKSWRYYRLRYPADGVYFQSDTITQQDTFYQDIAQFAPYVVRHGKAVPIYLIYCNRKLVYYYDVYPQQPYSFKGVPGYNQITIRTLEKEITIDSVWLQKGHKLVFSIDSINYANWEKSHLISTKKMPKHFNGVEQNIINNSILMLRKPTQKPATVWNENKDFYRTGYSDDRRVLKLGPFFSNTTLHFKEDYGLQNTFSFEPGFIYELEVERLKLYAHGLSYSLPYLLPLRSDDEVIYSPSILNRPIREAPISFHYTDKVKINQVVPHGHFRYAFKNNKDQNIRALVFEQKNQFNYSYDGHGYEISNIPAGEYTLFVFTNDKHYFQREITIPADTTYYIDFSQANFVPDSAAVLLREKANNSFMFIGRNNKNSIKLSSEMMGGRKVRGTIKDIDDNPLIGVNILVKGTTIGTISNAEGKYELTIPQDEVILEFTYTGYTTLQIDVRYNLSVDVIMNPSLLLDEIVVVGYAIQQKSQVTGSVTSITSDNMSAPNFENRTVDMQLNIGLAANRPPLYIIDGLEGDPASLDPQQIKSLKTLSETEAQAIYGSRGANGVIIISTTDGPNFDFFDPNTAKKLRTLFSDYAYWQPNLVTNKNGEAQFKASFPDNITSWETYALGMDKRKRAGMGYTRTQAFKPLIAQLAVPRFLIEGDQVDLIGKTSNYTSDSLQIETRFLLSDSLVGQQESRILNGNVESVKVQAGMAGDSLAITYTLATKDGTFFDGEKRDIPVFQKGTMEHQGQFLVLDKDTSLSLDFPAQLGRVEVYVEQDLLTVLLKEIDYLKNYQYGCNEQTASKLMALVLEKQIREQLGEVFEETASIGKCIKQLTANQNSQGGWGWWDNSQGISWVSHHVIKALMMAKEAGFAAPPLEGALRAITSQMKTITPRASLSHLLLLAEVGQVFPYEEYLPQIDSLQLSLYERLQTIQLRQMAGLPYNLETLYQYRQETMLGNYYWGTPSYQLHQNVIGTSLLAYDILQRANKPLEAKRVSRYFLEQGRNAGGRHTWRNTLETALILKSILPPLLAESGHLLQGTKLVLEGLVTTTIDTFPQRLMSTGRGQSLSIQKTGTGTLYLTAYQSFQQTNPEKKGDKIKVTSYLEQNKQKILKIEQGKPVDLIVVVDNKAAAEYVMLEIPIPAACSYYTQPPTLGRLEVHREYEKNQTSIFIAQLPPGQHIFKIQLEPRFSGRFHLNPAKVELMYFPVLYGREGMKVVEVSGQ
ncbi:MAG: alpha-2-macroglobulin family protein [Saprospiraceae bacterium]